MTDFHQPYHLRKAIVGTIQKLGKSVADEDCDVLLFWVTGIETLIRSCVDDSFRRRYSNEALYIDDFTFVIEEMKEVLHKVINKNNKKNKKQKVTQKPMNVPKGKTFQIQIEIH